MNKQTNKKADRLLIKVSNPFRKGVYLSEDIGHRFWNVNMVCVGKFLYNFMYFIHSWQIYL